MREAKDELSVDFVFGVVVVVVDFVVDSTDVGSKVGEDKNSVVESIKPAVGTKDIVVER